MRLIDDWCHIRVFPHRTGSLFRPPEPHELREALVLGVGPGHWSPVCGHIPCDVRAGDRVLLAPFTLVGAEAQCLQIEADGAGEWLIVAWDIWAVLPADAAVEVLR